MKLKHEYKRVLQEEIRTWNLAKPNILMHFECKHVQDELRQEQNLSLTTVWK